MNNEDIALEQLKSWLKDVKRISHELRELPSSAEPTFMTIRSMMFLHICKQLEQDL
jgi:hypothetical protein